MTQLLQINGGPSKFDLMISLFGEGRMSVLFSGVSNESGKFSEDVYITSLEKESGDGESWNFRGYASGNRKVEGFFSTLHRTGHIKFVEE